MLTKEISEVEKRCMGCEGCRRIIDKRIKELSQQKAVDKR
jgi:hypothetical protein